MQCNTNPTAGCGDASIVAEIKIQTNTIVTHLDEVKVAIENLQTQGEECCEETNTNLLSIEAKLDTLIANASECCVTQTGLFEQMVTLLQQLLNCECPTTSTTTSTTTICIPCPPVTTTTTTAEEQGGTTTTTTEEEQGRTTTTTTIDLIPLTCDSFGISWENNMPGHNNQWNVIVSLSGNVSVETQFTVEWDATRNDVPDSETFITGVTVLIGQSIGQDFVYAGTEMLEDWTVTAWRITAIYPSGIIDPETISCPATTTTTVPD